MEPLFELATAAIRLDQEGKPAAALQAYRTAVATWENAYRNETNPRIKQILRRKIHEFLERCQVISQALDYEDEVTRTPSTPPAATTKSDFTRDSLAKSEPKFRTEHETRKLSLSNLKPIKSDVTFADVAGLEQAKQAIREAVVLPRKFSTFFGGIRKPWQAILLYGVRTLPRRSYMQPPGTGKTFLAKATAHAVGAEFFSVTSSDVLSKWQGESEKQIKALFDVARDTIPSVIFIDEIDALCSSRSDRDTDSTRRIKTEFLVQMNNLTSKSNNDQILVLGATNVPWDLDVAVLRRFQRRIYIDLPDFEARKQLFNLNLRNAEHTLTTNDINHLAAVTNGYSAHDISVVIQDAFMQPIRELEKAEYFKTVVVNGEGMWTPAHENDCEADRGSPLDIVPMTADEVRPNEVWLPPVSMRDFEKVSSRTKRTVHENQIWKYNEWTAKHGIRGD